MQYKTIVRASGIYDLAVTLPFALPQTAPWAVGVLASVAAALGLPGDVTIEGDTAWLFINLFGSVVSVWSILRILHPAPLLGLYDSFARFLFSGWFLYYPLVMGTSAVSLLFFVPELLWGVVQLVGYLRLDRATASAETAATLQPHS